MKYVIVLALSLCFACPCEAGKFSVIIANAAVATRPNGPAPTPPNSVCSTCDGTGRLGDGTIEKVCPTCKGTGKSVTTATGAGVRAGAPAPVDGQLSPRGQWVYVESKRQWLPVTSGNNARSQGHWEDRVVCYGDHCEKTRVFVRD